jgi:hypothetical protein
VEQYADKQIHKYKDDGKWELARYLESYLRST